jgi:hypothetical protein
MTPPSMVNGLILNELQQIPPPEDTDIGIGPSRSSSRDAEHTHAKNVEDLDLNNYVV